VKVVVYGYDMLGSADSYILQGAAPLVRQLFGMPLAGLGATHYGGMLASLEKEYKAKGFSLTHVSLWGSLQAAMDEAAKSSKNEQYMQDPIHCNSKGYNILLGKLKNDNDAELEEGNVLVIKHPLRGVCHIDNMTPTDIAWATKLLRWAKYTDQCWI